MIIYQVLPRLFGNDNRSQIPNGSLAENGSGKFSAFSERFLKQLNRFGYSHIWYTGIIEHATQTDYSAYGIAKDHPAVVKGKAGSPYAVKDYFDIDPDLADDVVHRMAEFEALVERTHQSGLQCIIDFVPNHVARGYHSDARPQGVTDLGADDDRQTTFDRDNIFYYLPGQALAPQFDATVDGDTYSEFPARATGNDRFDANPSRQDWYETIKLNYGIDYWNGGRRHFDPIPDTWRQMLRILLFWASKKIDGFRCDMAEMVPVEFWAWVIPQVKQQYPGVIFIAEIYNPSAYQTYLSIGKFDFLYDKVGMYDTLRAVICGQADAAAISHCWQSVNDIRERMLYFLENHDEQRIASDFFARDPQKAFPAMLVLALLFTNPLMIYSGQELGEQGMDSEGFSGPDGRTSIFDYWSLASIRNWRNGNRYDRQRLSPVQKNCFEFYTQLLQLCRDEPAIYRGVSFDLMYANYENPRFNPKKHFAFLRQSGADLLLVVANFDQQEARLAVFIPAHAFEYMQFASDTRFNGRELFPGNDINLPAPQADALYELAVPPSSGKVLKFSKIP